MAFYYIGRLQIHCAIALDVAYKFNHDIIFTIIVLRQFDNKNIDLEINFDV